MKVLALGVALGLSAGISPGPLLALVLSGTLRGGLGVGLRVAAVPLLTDLPVIVLSVTVLSALPDRAVAAGGLVGGLFLLWPACTTLRDARTATLPRPEDPAAPGASPTPGALPGPGAGSGSGLGSGLGQGLGPGQGSGPGAGSEPGPGSGPGASVRTAAGRRTVRQGVVVNLLSPHPWLFWLTTGSPLLVDAWRERPGGAVGFLVAFYALLVGSKALLALVVARTRHRMNTRVFRLLLAGSGLLLLAASALLLASFGARALG
ncbi:LysE family transporter [Streptomyces mobaraensis]|uniref:LysE family transporter n=1 Tax=Streptomyces mobaraensis TaxID=35621 RepID=UPI0033DA8A16